MDTKELRNQAGALLDQAQTAVEQGEMETFQRLADEAQATMVKADEIDAVHAEDMSVIETGDGRHRMYYAACGPDGNWRIASAVSEGESQ